MRNVSNYTGLSGNGYTAGRGSAVLPPSSRSVGLCRTAAPLIVFCHCNLLQHTARASKNSLPILLCVLLWPTGELHTTMGTDKYIYKIKKAHMRISYHAHPCMSKTEFNKLAYTEQDGKCIHPQVDSTCASSICSHIVLDVHTTLSHVHVYGSFFFFKVCYMQTVVKVPKSSAALHVFSLFASGSSRSEGRRGAPGSTWSCCKYTVTWEQC